MRKSSRSISLALIGTALALSGCSNSRPDNEWDEGEESAQAPGVDRNAQAAVTGTNQYNHSGGHSYYNSPGRTASRIGGAMIGSQLGRNMGGGPTYAPAPGGAIAPGPGHPSGTFGGAPGAGTSAPSGRGGFGASAGHSSGSAAA